jgi:hypothetical protein
MQMQPEIDAASCISPLAFADGALSATPGAVSTPVDQVATFAVAASSVGGLALNGTVVTITIPAAITLVSAVPTAGNCSTGAGAVTCDLGSVPGGASRRIDMTVRGTQNGNFVAAATLAATNDSNAQNNSVNVSLNVGQTPAEPRDSGGGGGTLGWAVLLGLLLTVLRHLPLTPALSPKGRGG